MQKQEEIISRLKQIFDIFLRENFSTTNNVYFEKLITHLRAKENEFVLQAPFAVEWVDKCLDMICGDPNNVHPKVIYFMLNLCSFLASNEWMIIKLREQNIMPRAITFLKMEGQNFSPSIKLGGIRAMKGISSYSMGLAYLRSARVWSLLIEYSNNDHTLYVVREARELLFDMLYKYCDKFNDQVVTLEILAEILRPIHENSYDTNDEHIRVHVDDSELLHKISSALDLLTYILQQTLVFEERTNLVCLLKEHHDLDMTIWKLIDMTHNSYFCEKILTVLSSFNFALLVHEKLLNPECKEPRENFTGFGVFYFNLMRFCMTRNDFVNFVKLAEINHVLWKKLGKFAPKEIIVENERVAFENQLICFHMMPLLLSMKDIKKMGDETSGEPFDNYIMKLLDVSCQQTLRLCYSMRDSVITPEGTLNGIVTPQLANKCIHSILSLETILDREQAVSVCQALLYVLREVVALMESTNPMEMDCSVTSSTNYMHLYPRDTELIVKDPIVLHSVMVGLQTLIERFKITWKESVETIGLVNCLAFVLENCNMDARCTVQALKLVQLAVEHFLSPNMALLVDNLQGSGLVCLAPIIVKRLHDTSWEVRDSTLELTTSIACISRVKFPAFQNLLIDAEIPPIVYEMAKHDSEPYVRASAFKCLAKMVTINSMWESCLSQLDIAEHLLYVLYREHEDIIRTEAIITLSKIYDHRKIPTKYKNTLFSTLNYCIVGDHHWEVKLNALNFWRMEFQRQLNNQGMIDGLFPTVTFSKEHKKIVTLTEREIRLRMAKVLAEEQQYGYFGVILRCLREEYAMEVLQVIVGGINTMYEKLKAHDIDIILADIDTLTPPVNNMNSNFNFSTPMKSAPIQPESTMNADKAEEVIESILNVQDMHLLEKAFESQMQINHSETESRHIDEFYYKQFAISFRHYIEEIKKFDLDKLLKQQQEWLACNENFMSLLDDILHAIKRDDENMVSDCY